MGIVELGKLFGASKSTMALELSKLDAEPAGAPTQIDLDGRSEAMSALREIERDDAPIDILRTLLAVATTTIASLPADSPRVNQARAEARALTKLIAGFEKDRAKEETPEELKRRLRREDGDVRERLERYVLQHEAHAAERNECEKCGRPFA